MSISLLFITTLFYISFFQKFDGIDQGPTLMDVVGSNTNKQTVPVNVTTAVQSSLSVTAFNPSNRLVPVPATDGILTLTVTNDISGSTVTGVTVSDKASCPQLQVTANNNCGTVSPGGTCTLELSSDTPYVPCKISISGTGANSTTTTVAFFYLGGLVFDESNGTGKVVTDGAPSTNTTWTATYSDVEALSYDDGAANSAAIIASPACVNNLQGCAAYSCYNKMGSPWYLPALNELTLIHNVLCSNNAIPCNFGDFPSDLFWSSTEVDFRNARTIDFPTGSLSSIATKDYSTSFICVRSF